MLPSLVIDASVIISWYNPDENNTYAHEILFCLNKELAITPQLCCLEVNNVLRVLEKRKIIPTISVDKAVASIDNLPILKDSTPISFRMPLVLTLSRTYDLTIYDACYLELAVRLNLPLATLDNKLKEALKAAGLALKTV